MNYYRKLLIGALVVLPLVACGGDVRSDVVETAAPTPAAEELPAAEAVMPVAMSVEEFESAAVRKDVPYVPTPYATVDEMLRMARISSKDLLYDLGSGDGRIVITAAKDHGARGIGIDIDPQRISEANENAEAAGVTDRVRFVQGDLFQTNLSEATAVTLYLLRSVNLRLRPKLLEELRPGTPVVSHDFDMGEWAPDEEKRVGGDQLYLWIIPARIDGVWTWNGADGERRVRLSQDFQKFTGRGEGGGMEVRNGRLNGAEITFELVRGGAREQYRGRVSGNTIEGTVESAGRRTAWRAQRG
jgi:hypothetical protein